MGDNSKNTMDLKTQREQLVKQALVYDGIGRLESVKTAATDAVDGTPCSQVLYEYVDAASTLVIRMKERAKDQNGDKITWSSADDVTEP